MEFARALLAWNVFPDAATRTRGIAPSGISVVRPDLPGAVLYVHGNGDNVGTLVYEAGLIAHALKRCVVIYDPPGYGVMPGPCSEAGCRAAADRALAYTVEHCGCAVGDVVLWGRSMGGAMCFYLAARHRVRAVVTESAFTSVSAAGHPLLVNLAGEQLAARAPPAVARAVQWAAYGVSYVFFSVATRVLGAAGAEAFDSLQFAPEVQCPVHIVHGELDELISPAHAYRLRAAVPQPGVFEIVRGAVHCIAFDARAGFIERVRCAIEKIEPPAEHVSVVLV